MHLLPVLTLTITNVSKAGQIKNPWAIFYVKTTMINVINQIKYDQYDLC